MKTKIFYVAYKTCESLTKYQNPLRLTNAKILISTNISFHIIEVIFFTYLFTSKQITKIDITSILVFIAINLLTIAFVTIFFTKKVLVKSINKYSNTLLAKYARLIGLTYMLLNFILASIIFVMQSNRTWQRRNLMWSQGYSQQIICKTGADNCQHRL